MIADREKRIELIQRKSNEQREKEVRISAELETVSEQNAKASIEYQTTKSRLLHSYQSAAVQLENMQRDLKQQGSSLAAYAGAVHKQRQQDADSDAAYVMRMQAQLCKAMHTLGILDHQMELVKTHADTLIRQQKDAVAAVREEKSQVELDLMNDLMKIDTERRALETDFEAKLEEIRKEREAMADQLEASEEEDSEEEDSEEDEDDDEEERQAKEELMNMLKERRAAIDRLEKGIQEQTNAIQELEEQMEEFDDENSQEETPPAPKLDRRDGRVVSRNPINKASDDYRYENEGRDVNDDANDDMENEEADSEGQEEEDEVQDDGNGEKLAQDDAKEEATAVEDREKQDSKATEDSSSNDIEGSESITAEDEEEGGDDENQ